MFVSDNTGLIGNSHHDLGGFVQNHTLASQAAFQARVGGAVNEILFLIGKFFELVIAFFHINVTGGAGANAAAVVIQVYVSLFGDFQNRHVFEISRNRFGRNFLVFELKSYSCHKTPQK